MSDGTRPPVKAAQGDWALRLLLAASIIVPLGFFATVAIIIYRNEEHEAHDVLVRTADLIREHASRVFDSAELLARSIEPITRDMDDAAIQAGEALFNLYLEQLITPYDQFYSVAIVDRLGVPLVSARTFPLPAAANLSEREYFIALRDNPSLGEYVSRVLRTPDGETTFFQIARPRIREGVFDGIVAVSVQPDYFRAVYANFAGDSPLVAALVRADGYILALHPYPEVRLDEVEAVEDFAAAIADVEASGGVLTVPSSSLGGLLLTFRQVGDRPIYVAAAYPLSAVTTEWLEFMAWVLAGLAPLTLALFLISLHALRRNRDRAVALAELQAETARRKTAEEGLRQSQKMEAIGQLSGGIAHDFNNLMTAISGNLDLIKRRLKSPDPAILRYIDAGREAVQSAARLTQRLLAFSRRQPLRPETVNINVLVSGMNDLLHRSLGDSVSVETVLAAGLWPTQIDRNQLENALLNLAINGRDAMPEGGKLTIETANAYLDRKYIDREGLTDIEPGQYVLLAVTDTGSGMTKEILERAFDPFFTTKAPGQGTGLGLSMVHGLVKQSGGHIKIYSELGHGTTVKLYLPRATAGLDEADVQPASEVLEMSSGETRTVLLVEDDPGVLEFERETLVGAGYEVLTSRDGPEALKILESDLKVDLVVTDVVLPEGMSGRVVADAVARLRPGLPVLFATGYTANAIIHQGRLDPDVTLLTKPFSAAEFSAAVARMMRKA